MSQTEKNRKMKNIKLIIAGIFFLFLSIGVMAQPDPPAEGHGSGNDASGGGAPIGGGLLILLSLGAAYGGKKLYDLKKESLEE